MPRLSPLARARCPPWFTVHRVLIGTLQQVLVVVGFGELQGCTSRALNVFVKYKSQQCRPPRASKPAPPASVHVDRPHGHSLSAASLRHPAASRPYGNA